MKVPLASFCPVCKSKSQPNRLNRNLGDEEVFCVNPRDQKPLHVFKTIEEAEAYDPTLAFLEAQGEAEEKIPTPTPKPKAVPRVEAPEPKAAELDPLPVAVVEPEEPAVVIEAEATREIPSLFNAEKAAKVVKFTPPPARTRSGGVLLMTVKIPDQFVGSLKQEAENQKQSPEVWFQEAVERALEYDWWF